MDLLDFVVFRPLAMHRFTTRNGSRHLIAHNSIVRNPGCDDRTHPHLELHLTPNSPMAYTLVATLLYAVGGTSKLQAKQFSCNRF